MRDFVNLFVFVLLAPLFFLCFSLTLKSLPDGQVGTKHDNFKNSRLSTRWRAEAARQHLETRKHFGEFTLAALVFVSRFGGFFFLLSPRAHFERTRDFNAVRFRMPVLLELCAVCALVGVGGGGASAALWQEESAHHWQNSQSSVAGLVIVVVVVVVVARCS